MHIKRCLAEMVYLFYMSDISTDTILSTIVWDESSEKGTVTVPSPLFGKSAEFSFYVDTTPSRVTKTMEKNFIGYTQFKNSELEKIKDLLWEDCLFSCNSIDCGFEKVEGKTMQESNLQNFNIKNKDDAYAQTGRMKVLMDEEDESYSNRYYTISFDVPWGDLVYIIVKNDMPIASYSDFPYFGWYEEGGKYYE
jgi:hypothetical protein